MSMILNEDILKEKHSHKSLTNFILDEVDSLRSKIDVDKIPEIRVLLIITIIFNMLMCITIGAIKYINFNFLKIKRKKTEDIE